MSLSLSPPFEQLWKDKDPFQEAFALKGRVYREIESRRTIRFELNNQGYFVKLHYGLGWWPVIREWLKGGSLSTGAQAEYTALKLLEKIGVHSMQPMAFGAKRANPATQQSFLITKELGNTTSLEEFCKDWPSKPPCPRLKRALITEVASIVRKIHTAGMNHRDCYLVHFLLHNDSLPTDAESESTQSPMPRVSLIDLHRAQVRAKVPQRWRNKDLAALAYSSANIGLSFKNQCRFLKTYFQKPLHYIFTQEKPLLAFLQSETIRLTNRWDEKFSQAALEQHAHQHGFWMNPNYAAPLAEKGVTAANAFDHFWTLQLETTDPPNTGRGGLSEVFQTHIASVEAYLKRQTMHLKYSLQAPFGEPTFAHEFRSLQRAQTLGISTPKVIFFGQKNLPGKPKSAILITESLASTHQSLSNILANWQRIAQPQRLEIMAAIGSTVARLHAANLSHNCLYPKHIFIARTPANTVDIALIDFEKTRPAWRADKKKTRSRSLVSTPAKIRHTN
jgi:heptose I phosphotransferase